MTQSLTDVAERTPQMVSVKAALKEDSPSSAKPQDTTQGSIRTKFLFDRHLHKDFPTVVGGDGNYIFLEDGRKLFDSSSGAAVSCLGHNYRRVFDAMTHLMKTGTPYIASSFYSHRVVEAACKEIIRGTNGRMARVYLTGSGSEAMEAAIKLARQYFYEKDKNTRRVNFIAREGSYHGNTIGALGISGHPGRRAPYLPFLMDNVHHISSCNAYRQRTEDQSDASFVEAKAAELEAKFQELGSDTVIAFIMEPVVGAALGCVPYIPGYMAAMRDICHRHGALFILDEVMCGMGRTGTLHAWQAEDVAPDLQTIGKGLAGGYQPIAAVLISEKIVNAMLDGSGQFVHGQTYQGMPIQAAAVLEVQRIKRELNLVENVRIQGEYLEKLLRSSLEKHPNVGNIRGKGLFWGVEFVEIKETKAPFKSSRRIAQKVHDIAMSEPYNIVLYPGTGSAGGIDGDHVIIAPTYLVTKEDIEYIVKATTAAVHAVFSDPEAY